MMLSIRAFASFSLLWLASFVSCPLYGQAQGIEELLESATSAQASGHYAEAASFYARATELAPNQPELWSNVGVMQFLSGQIESSIVSLKHALQLNPKLFAPLLFLGKDFVQTGKPALALTYLDRAHALHPDDVEVLLALGKANLDLNAARAAATSYASATRIAPDNAEAWFGVAVSSLQVINADGHSLASTEPQSVWARSLYADELLAQGRPLEAADTYKAALAKASPMERATLVENIEWMQSHRKQLQLPPNSQDALGKLSVDVRSQTASTAFTPCTSSAHQREPASSADALLRDAGCTYRAGDDERSALQAGRALRQSPRNAEALYWSIKSNERIAVTALARFEELSPQSAANFVLVGNLYRLQRQPDSALGEYQRALSVDAHDPSALLGAALASLSANRLDEAAAFDRTALSDRPLDPQLNLLMAEILDAGNHSDQMGAYLAKCTDAPPELQPRVHYLLGRVYAQEGKTAEAIEQFALVLPGDKDGSIHYQLARLYQKAGNTAEAQKLLAQAKALIGKRDVNAAIVVREATATNP